MIDMEFLKFRLYDTVELKKPHPCGSKLFRIMRVGSEVRLICQGCGRDMVMDRVKLEKATKKLFPAETEGRTDDT